MIIGIDHLLGFDKDGLTGSRFVMNDTAYLPLESGRHRDDESSFAQRRSGIGFYEPVGLGLA